MSQWEGDVHVRRSVDTGCNFYGKSLYYLLRHKPPFPDGLRMATVPSEPGRLVNSYLIIN